MPAKEPTTEKSKKRILVEEMPEEEEKSTKTETASDFEVKETKESAETTEETTTKEEVGEEKEAPVSPLHDQKISSFSLLDVEKPKEESSETPETKEETSPLESEAQTEDNPPEDKKEVSSEEVKNWLKDVRPDTSSQDLDKESKPGVKSILIIVILIGVIGAVIGGIFYYRSKVSKNTQPTQKTAQAVTPSTAPTSASSPTPTASQSADLSKYSVNVQNGSGVVGEAGKAKDLLTKAGFTKLTTGNAANYNYTNTEISFQKDTPDSVVSAVKDALSVTYTVTVKDTNLDSSSSYSIQVIVGTEK